MIKDNTDTNLPPEISVRVLNPDPESSIWDVLGRLGELLTLAAILAGVVFSLGFSYAHAWFTAWKLPMNTLDISRDVIFEYGRLTLMEHVVISVLIAILVAALVWWMHRNLKNSKGVLPFAFSLFLLVSWLGTDSLGKLTANEHFKSALDSGFQQLPFAEVIVKTSADLPDDFKIDIHANKPCYRLVYLSPNAVWLARTRDHNADPMIAMVPRDQIVLMRLHPVRGNCQAG